MITVLQCDPTDLSLILDRYEEATYWDVSMTQIESQSVDRETIIPYLSGCAGSYVLNGLISPSGVSESLQYQLINLSRQNPSLDLVLISPRCPVPVGLYPFVVIESEPYPNAAKVHCILNDRGIDDPSITRSALGLTHGEINLLLDRFEGSTNLSDEFLRYKSGKLQALGFRLLPEPDVQIAGLENITKALDRAAALLDPDAEEYGLNFPKGCLLWGVPGTGKTLCAKHAATRMGVPLISIDWSALIDPEPGRSEANFRTLLQIAEAIAPCVLYADDFDKAFSSGDLSTVSATEKRIIGLLLTWMQDRTAPVYFMASVNRAEQMPPELKRRFDDIFFVGYPHQGMMKKIFDYHLQLFTDTFEASDLQWQQILRRYSRCTPAEIALAVARCAEQSYFEKRPKDITPDDIISQRSKFVSGYTRDQSAILRIEANQSLAIPATPDDDSIWKIEDSELFKSYQGV